MKIAVVVKSDHGDLAAGMRGLLRGPGPDGSVAVLFPKLHQSAWRRTVPVTIALFPGEFTIEPAPTCDLPFVVSATLPPALLLS